MATRPALALVPLQHSADDAIERARAISPELEGAALAIETSTAAAAVARRDLKPDFSVQGGYMNRGGLDAMWLAGVGISWPFNKKARESAVAEAEIRAKGGSHIVESMDLQLAFQTRERFTRAKSLEKLVALYDGGIVPQDRMTVEATMTNYQSAKVPFVSVLEAMTALYADRCKRGPGRVSRPAAREPGRGEPGRRGGMRRDGVRGRRLHRGSSRYGRWHGWEVGVHHENKPPHDLRATLLLMASGGSPPRMPGVGRPRRRREGHRQITTAPCTRRWCRTGRATAPFAA